MTKDLALLIGPDQPWLTTQQFLDALAGELDAGARRLSGPGPMPGPMAARLSIRIDLPGGRRVGPGKIRLLELIDETGSISAAGRAMAMSYRRAWLLVESLNTGFREPVVDAQPGGRHGGGARLTSVRPRAGLALSHDGARGGARGRYQVDAIADALAPQEREA